MHESLVKWQIRFRGVPISRRGLRDVIFTQEPPDLLHNVLIVAPGIALSATDILKFDENRC